VLMSSEHIPLHVVGTRKLLMKWMGPFTIVKVDNEVAYQVKLPDGWRMHDGVHVSLLKPYYSNGEHQPPPPALLVDGEEEEEILTHEPRSMTKGDNKTTFLVKWKGFGHEHNTIESRSRTCRMLLCHSESTGTGLQCKQLSLLQATAVG